MKSVSCLAGSDGSCHCIDLLKGYPPQRRCNATDEYGPRGVWIALTFEQDSGPCPSGTSCTSTWRLTPDGALTMSKLGVPSAATVDAPTLGIIRDYIDGSELRGSLRDGFQCDPPPTDVGWTMNLELSSGTLQGDVTGCITTGPTGNLAAKTFQELAAY